MQTLPSQRIQTLATPKGSSLENLDPSQLGFQSIKIMKSYYKVKWLTRLNDAHIKYNTRKSSRIIYLLIDKDVGQGQKLGYN